MSSSRAINIEGKREVRVSADIDQQRLIALFGPISSKVDREACLRDAALEPGNGDRGVCHSPAHRLFA